MTRTIKTAIPKIVIYLLQEHSAEWSAVQGGSISYQLRRGQGYFVIFRTPSLGSKRLVSAHIPTRIPKTETEWQSLRTKMTEKGKTNITDAKHRYLFVSTSRVSIAAKAMSGTKVKVKAVPS
jgi:hypothetical protein